MKFEQLPKWAQKDVINDILSGLCDGCQYEHNCPKGWKADCKERAHQVAIDRGEFDGYVLVEDMDTESRGIKLRSEVDDYELIIKE